MTKYVVETIDLTPTSRIVVECDTDAQNPRGDWHMLTGALTCSPYYARRDAIDVEPVYDFPGDLADAEGRFTYADEIARWARVFYSITLEWHDSTYWWVDPAQMAENWPELAVGSAEYVAREREVITSERAVYQTWCDGEIYVVRLERLETWAKVGDTDDTQYLWEHVEALGGCYLYDQYTAEEVAREHFTLTLAESAPLAEKVTA
jgi:hypothetical protein